MRSYIWSIKKSFGRTDRLIILIATCSCQTYVKIWLNSVAITVTKRVNTYRRKKKKNRPIPVA